MKKSLLTLALLAGVAISAFPSMVQAADSKVFVDNSDSPWQFRVRGIGVLPVDGGHTTIGGEPNTDNAFVPEFDITYFFTKNIAAELILATSPHDLTLKGSTLGDVDLGDTWILPPVLTLQYHFTPDQSFSPYVGAGLNYTLPYSEEAAGGTVTALEADGSLGYAVQAGADFWLNDNWGLNFDVKKVWVDVDASINNGAITGEVELNPLIVGAGISYRF